MRRYYFPITLALITLVKQALCVRFLLPIPRGAYILLLGFFPLIESSEELYFRTGNPLPVKALRRKSVSFSQFLNRPGKWKVLLPYLPQMLSLC